jgi:hypothetical protein
MPSLVLGGFACAASEPAPSAVAPPREGWESVSEMLGVRCGSLDCHGRAGRPLRLFHHDGLRISPSDIPGGKATTQAEHEANLRGVVGLEPELFVRVVGEGGLEPERLTLVRKALGLESHKGGAPLAVAGSADACLRTWLAAKTDEPACAAAATWERP